MIPARLTSSRFYAKLLAKVQGKTVLQRTFESASNCSSIDSLYVATDSQEIAAHIEDLGGNVIWTTSNPKDGTERICEALQNHPELKKASCIVNLQGDHPCMRPSTIEAIIKELERDPKASLATAATPIRSEEEFLSPHVVKCVFDQERRALYFSRSPIPYGKFYAAYAHIGIYCYRTSFLQGFHMKKPTPLQEAENLEQLKVLEGGDRVKIAIVDEIALSVDVPSDLVKLEEYLWKQNTFL